jgi:hypothetical protein
MKTISIIIILASLDLYAFAANQPEDGFYLRILKDDTAKQYQDQDGLKFLLGEKQNLKIQSCEIISNNNENTMFHLSLTIPYEEKISSAWHVLFVGGIAYRQTGSGSSNKEILMMGFNIAGQENIKQVSKYLNIPVHYRKHPQHNLLVKFTPAKEQYDAGEEVTAILRIKNVGDKAIKFVKGGRNRAARDNQYIFNAYLKGKQVPDIGTNFHMGGLSVSPTLKPGEMFEDEISLSKWFSFNEPGAYEIHGSYYLDFQDPDSKIYRTIWQDCASADFTVKVEEAGSSGQAFLTTIRNHKD